MGFDTLTVLTDVTGSLTYVGEALPGVATTDSKWRIIRIDDATSGAVISYADNHNSFSRKWSDRTTYSYTVT